MEKIIPVLTDIRGAGDDNHGVLHVHHGSWGWYAQCWQWQHVTWQRVTWQHVRGHQQHNATLWWHDHGGAWSVLGEPAALPTLYPMSGRSVVPCYCSQNKLSKRGTLCDMSQHLGSHLATGHPAYSVKCCILCIGPLKQ